MPLTVDRAKEEGRKVLVTAVFFAIGFCIIVVHNRLLTEGTGLRTVSLARALIGGLIAAKVLMSVDMLPFFDAFPHKPIACCAALCTARFASRLLTLWTKERLILDMTVVSALAYFVQRYWTRRFAFRDRGAPHVFVESRR